ncbi:MAG: efflux RND transporter periplasmic adaptor subunit, partial [Candidatus Aminicenantaceae bacterium]
MKNNKRFMVTGVGILILILILSIFIISCGKGEENTQIVTQEKSTEKAILYYTCGMHPSVRVSPEDYERGNTKCPICNMDLVPVYEEKVDKMEMKAGEHAGHGVIEEEVKLSSRAQSLAQVKTEEIQFLPLFREINTVGNIDYDERKIASVAAWIAGRIDKLFVDFTGVNVKKGDPLVLIYSPDLVTTQEEYLLALETLERVKESKNEETIEGAESLVEASKKRLILWGINEKQIEELKQRKRANTHMTIYAPIGGTVIHKNAMEGKYVKEGENLYQIADLANLWILADIYEYEMAWIKKGQKVEITSSAYPGEKFSGKISFIEPYLNPKTRSVKVRVNVPNPRLKLKPGMYVNVFVRSQIHEGIRGSSKVVYTCTMHPEVISDKPGECPECGMFLVKKEITSSDFVLAVPKGAVLDTGKRKVVYIEKEEGTYVAKEIEVGPVVVASINGKKKKFYAVKAGLSEGMRVVSQANFLIDSQSLITGQAEAIYGGA